MPRFPRSRRAWFGLASLLLLLALLFLSISDNTAIWPVRNTLLYQATRWWAEHIGASQPASLGALHGCVRGVGALPLADAAVIVAERDGTLHQARADARGCYEIGELPAGRYVPIISAPGYDAAAIRPWGLPARVGAGGHAQLDATLVPLSLPAVRPGRLLQISAPV